MATMLGFLMTDAKPALDAHLMLRGVVDRSFNRVTIDGDTSPNDTVILWSSGQVALAPARPEAGASEPLTEAFHRARVRADTLRPADADDIDDAADVERYRDSVREYVVSFEAAEREARRRRDSGFTAAEQASLSRARKLVATAEDGGATPAERQTAYKKLRDELRGIIDVPSAAGERIERSIAQALERGRD